MTRTLIALLLMSSPAYAGCGKHDETGNDTFDMSLCANVEAYCIMGSEHVPCEDIPVFPLTEEDYSEPPTPAEQWASAVAWREQGE